MRQMTIAFVALLLTAGMLAIALAVPAHLATLVARAPAGLLPALTMLGNAIAVCCVIAVVIRRKRQLADDD